MCEIDDVKIGIIVDDVSDILNIKAHEIKEQADEMGRKLKLYQGFIAVNDRGLDEGIFIRMPYIHENEKSEFDAWVDSGFIDDQPIVGSLWLDSPVNYNGIQLAGAGLSREVSEGGD